MLADMSSWTALFGLACFQSFPRLRVLATLVLGLEWAGTLALVHSTWNDSPSDGHQRLLERCNSNSVLDRATRRYFSDNTRNGLAFLAKACQFTLPLALYTLANLDISGAEMPLAALVAASIPGCLLYLNINFQTILTFLPNWMSGSSPAVSPPLQLLCAFHIVTFPLLLLFLPGLRAPVPEGRDDAALFYLVKSTAKRAVTGFTVFLQIKAAGPDGRGVRSLALGWWSAVWTYVAWLLAYWEAGDVIPILHGGLYKDLTVDKWIIDAERALFGSQPAVDWREQLGADHGSLAFELFHVVYFCFIPLMFSTTWAMRIYAPLRPFRWVVERNLTAIYAAMSLCWLCLPVYGPVIALGPTCEPGLSERASHLVWNSSHKSASTGTALPSGHCAVTTMVALSVLDVVRQSDVGALRRALVLGAYAAMTTLICFSTVVNGFHYVSDAVLGVALAVGTHALCHACLGCPLERTRERRSLV